MVVVESVNKYYCDDTTCTHVCTYTWYSARRFFWKLIKVKLGPLLLGSLISLAYTFFTNFHSSSSQYGQIILVYFFLPIPLLHTSLHLHKFPCRIFHTRFHCFHLPILSCCMPLRYFTSTACTLDCSYFSSSKSDPPSLLIGGYNSLNHCIPPLTHSYLS